MIQFFYIESVLCRNPNTEQNIPADRKKGEMDRGWVCYKDLKNNMCRMLHRWQHITTYTWKPGFSSGSQSGWHAPYGGIELLQGHHVLKLTSSRPKCDEVYHTRYIRENQWVAENLHRLELDFERQTNAWEFSVTPWFRNNICLMRLRRTSFHVPGLHTKVFIYGESATQPVICIDHSLHILSGHKWLMTHRSQRQGLIKMQVIMCN